MVRNDAAEPAARAPPCPACTMPGRSSRSAGRYRVLEAAHEPGGGDAEPGCWSTRSERSGGGWSRPWRSRSGSGSQGRYGAGRCRTAMRGSSASTHLRQQEACVTQSWTARIRSAGRRAGRPQAAPRHTAVPAGCSVAPCPCPRAAARAAARSREAGDLDHQNGWDPGWWSRSGPTSRAQVGGRERSGLDDALGQRGADRTAAAR
jgi:hypothetical protein